MKSSGYSRVTVVTNSDTEEWKAVATVVLLLSQTRTLRNDKQWLRSCYSCHKLGHWGMTSSGYDRVTVVTNSALRNDKQWLRLCDCCYKLGHWGMTNSGYPRVTVITNAELRCQAVTTIVLLLSPVSQTRTLRNDKQGLRWCYSCHKPGHKA